MENRPKTSQSQLKATKKYLKAHPGILREGLLNIMKKNHQILNGWLNKVGYDVNDIIKEK